MADSHDSSPHGHPAAVTPTPLAGQEHTAADPHAGAGHGDEHESTEPAAADHEHDERFAGVGGTDESHSHAEEEAGHGDAHGTEADAPSDITRSVVLGGFAAANSVVIVTAAILKRRMPEKSRARTSRAQENPSS